MRRFNFLVTGIALLVFLVMPVSAKKFDTQGDEPAPGQTDLIIKDVVGPAPGMSGPIINFEATPAIKIPAVALHIGGVSPQGGLTKEFGRLSGMSYKSYDYLSNVMNIPAEPGRSGYQNSMNETFFDQSALYENRPRMEYVRVTRGHNDRT